MSNRKTILAAIANDPATVADLTDATGWPQRKVRDTIGDLKNVGLVISRRDDITGQPMYAITPAGREWLASKTQPAAADDKPRTLSAMIHEALDEALPVGRDEAPEPQEDPEQLQRIIDAHKLTLEAMRARVADLEKEVADKAQRIAALESNAELPLRTATAPAKYALTFLSELHDSPEAAMAKMLDVYDPSCIDLAVVVACETVGKIELRPILVPA